MLSFNDQIIYKILSLFQSEDEGKVIKFEDILLLTNNLKDAWIKCDGGYDWDSRVKFVLNKLVDETSLVSYDKKIYGIGASCDDDFRTAVDNIYDDYDLDIDNTSYANIDKLILTTEDINNIRATREQNDMEYDYSE